MPAGNAPCCCGSSISSSSPSSPSSPAGSSPSANSSPSSIDLSFSFTGTLASPCAPCSDNGFSVPAKWLMTVPAITPSACDVCLQSGGRSVILEQYFILGSTCFWQHVDPVGSSWTLVGCGCSSSTQAGSQYGLTIEDLGAGEYRYRGGVRLTGPIPGHSDCSDASGLIQSKGYEETHISNCLSRVTLYEYASSSTGTSVPCTLPGSITVEPHS